MLKRFSTYLLSLVTIGVLAHEKNDGTTYLDSLISQLEIAEKVQRDEHSLSLTLHLIDTLSYFSTINTDCYYVSAYNYRAAQILGQDNYEEGMAFYKKAIERNETCKSIESEMKSWNGLGSYHAIYKTAEEAEYYFLKSDSIRKANNSDYLEFVINYNLALVSLDQNKIKKGLSYLDIIKQKSIEKKDSFNTAVVFFAYSYAFELSGDYKNTIASYEQGIKNHPKEVTATLKHYIGEYVRYLLENKKYEKVVEVQKRQNAILQETLDNYKIEFESKMVKQYHEKEKQFEIDRLNWQNKLAEEKTINNDKIVKLGLVIMILIILILLYTIRNLAKQKKYSILLNKQNSKLEAAKNTAQELLKLKTQFTETVSHELRTPLHGIIGITDILIEEEKQNLSHKGQGYLDSLKYSGDYLLNLINDVLQYSKLDADKLTLQETPFNIKYLTSNLSSTFRYLIRKNNIKFNVYLDDEIPFNLIGDSVRLSQIIINLTGNAIKFTQNGYVSLRLILVSKNDEEVKIKFEIEDTGEGIAREKQKEIFEKFIQIKHATNDAGGTGLGLPIVQKLLRLFNSDIHLKSELGEGSLFWFEIKFNYENQVKNDIVHLPDHTEPVKKVSNGLKVLIVDDNEINRIVSHKTLLNNQFESDYCTNGLEAMQMIKNTSYNVVLLDLHMPKLDGIETIKRIREFDENLPVILLTASSVETNWIKYKKLGFNDFIIKPYDRFNFIQTILNQVK